MNLIASCSECLDARCTVLRPLCGSAMKNALISLIGIGLIAANAIAAQGVPVAFDPVRTARTALDTIILEGHLPVVDRPSVPTASTVNHRRFAEDWGVIVSKAGRLRESGRPVADIYAGGAKIDIPLRFEQGQIHLLITFDSRHRISDYRLASIALQPQPVSAQARFHELDVWVGSAADGLPATLTLPRGSGPFAAVVLVHGLGVHDRNETIGPNRPFLDIARGLSERGVAVLRYEKRTKMYPNTLVDGGLTIDRETTDDAVSAVLMLRRMQMIDPSRIFVLGHSQGGMLAPRIARREPSIAGIILLAAPARPLLDLLIEQHRRLAIMNDGVINDAERLAIQRIVEGTQAIRSGRQITTAQAPMGLPASYWRTVDAVDAKADAAAITQPMLILQGGRDIQVVSADWLAWNHAFRDTPRVSFIRYDRLNHLGIAGTGQGSMEDYLKPGDVAPELLDDVALWIELLKGVRPA